MIVWHYHHIVPKHMGGTDDPSNLLKCNIAMHSFLHKCLFEEYGNWQDEIAYKALSGQITNAEAIKIAQQRNTGKFKEGNQIWIGRKHTEETKEKMRKKHNFNYVFTDEHKCKLSKSHRTKKNKKTN